MSKWPVAWVTPTNSFDSQGVMEFVKKEVIIMFGPPQYIMSDNDLKFDCTGCTRLRTSTQHPVEVHIDP